MYITDKLRNGWSLLKFIRVGLSSLILYSSVQTGDVAGMVLGGLFTLLSLFTDGVCGGAGSCYTTGNRNKSSNEITGYEKLGVK